MKNKAREKKQSIVILFLNCVIVVMCIIMLGFGYVAINSICDVFSSLETEESMHYRLEDGEFYRMVEAYHLNVQGGHEASEEMQEYYGVAKYYEAASLYKAFVENGDLERAERELEKMEEAKDEMGQWVIVESQIKEQLGLE